MYISTAYRKSIFSVELCSKAGWAGSGSGLDELISSNCIISTAYRKSIFSVELCSKDGWAGSGSGLDELISSNFIISTAYRKSIFSCAQKLADRKWVWSRRAD